MKQKARKKKPAATDAMPSVPPSLPSDAEKRPLPAEGHRGRYVYHRRLRCPDCGSPDRLKAMRSEQQEDGTRTRRTWCRACGAQFIAVLE